jgi:hypothetical protein
LDTSADGAKTLTAPPESFLIGETAAVELSLASDAAVDVVVTSTGDASTPPESFLTAGVSLVDLSEATLADGAKIPTAPPESFLIGDATAAGLSLLDTATDVADRAELGDLEPAGDGCSVAAERATDGDVNAAGADGRVEGFHPTESCDDVSRSRSGTLAPLRAATGDWMGDSAGERTSLSSKGGGASASTLARIGNGEDASRPSPVELLVAACAFDVNPGSANPGARRRAWVGESSAAAKLADGRAGVAESSSELDSSPKPRRRSSAARELLLSAGDGADLLGI